MAGIEQLLPAEIFAVFLVFARVGSALVLMPGFGETYINVRFRLLLAGAVSLLLTPVISPRLPPLPADLAGLFLLLGGEILIGLFLGLLVRLVLTALQTAGMIIALQASLSTAFSFDPSTGISGALAGAWLTMIALVLIFITDTHHLFLRGIADSYLLFQPGQLGAFEDMTLTVARGVARSFALAVEISAPFLILGFVFLLALGLLNRLMPQMQVFMIIMPAQIALGVGLLGLTIAGAMAGFFSGIESVLTVLSGR